MPEIVSSRFFASYGRAEAAKHKTVSPVFRKTCLSAIIAIGMAPAIGLALFVALVAPSHAQALQAGSSVLQPAAGQVVQAVLSQSKVVKAADGTEKLEDASKVKPGDVIEYKVTYTNASAKAVSGLVANLPIPEGLAYQPRSAKPGADLLKVAAADGNFSAEPLLRKAGSGTERVPYGDYRQLRWTLGQLPAHGVVAVTARAQVESVIPVLPALINPNPASAIPASKTR